MRGRQSSLFARCDRGTLRVEEGGGSYGGPCDGTFHAVQGQYERDRTTLVITMSERQDHDWGVALYREVH